MLVPFSHADVSLAVSFQVILRACQGKEQDALLKMREYTFHLNSAEESGGLPGRFHSDLKVGD